jgi:hypothetical protein
MTKRRVKSQIDAPPSSLLNPKRVQLCQRAKVVGTWCCSQLSALKGVKGHAESSEIRLGKGTTYLVTRSCIKTNHIQNHFWCWDKPRATRTHLTHHGSDLGEATTFPHIVFSTFAHDTYIWMVFLSQDS